MTVPLKELTSIRIWVNKFDKLSPEAQDLTMAYLNALIKDRDSQEDLPLKAE